MQGDAGLAEIGAPGRVMASAWQLFLIPII